MSPDAGGLGLLKTAILFATTGTARNAVGVMLCLFYGLAALAGALLLRRSPRISPWLARRILQVVAGGWVIIAFYWIALWPAMWFAPLFLMYVNYRARRHPWMKPLLADGENEEPPLGTLWPALVLALLFWWPGYQFILISGVLVQTTARGTAAIVGRYWGRQRFRDRELRNRTFEGIAGMAVASLLLLFAVIYGFAQIPGVWFGPWTFFGALLATAVATVTQLYTPQPYDRWAVPLLTALTVHYYSSAGFHF